MFGGKENSNSENNVIFTYQCPSLPLESLFRMLVLVPRLVRMQYVKEIYNTICSLDWMVGYCESEIVWKRLLFGIVS